MSDSDLELGGRGETERAFERRSDNICNEYIVTGRGVCWTFPRVDDLG